MSNTIPGMDVFDPQVEALKIKEAPKSERAELLNEFKERMTTVVGGIAKIGADVIETVSEKPHITTEDLMVQVIVKSKDLGLTTEDYLTIDSLLSKFMNDHDKVREVYDRNNGDPLSIYREVFGASPQGKVEIISGPCCLYFRCFNDEDYKYIYGRGYPIIETDPAVRDKIIASEAASSSGFNLGGFKVNGVEGSIVVEKASLNPNGINMETYNHELRHILNRYLIHTLDYKAKAYLELATRSTSKEDKTYFMEQYLEAIRQQYIDSQAADELIAYMSTGRLDMLDKLTRAEASGGVYDYFARAHRFWQTINFSLEDIAFKILGPQNIDLIQQSMETVFITDYHKLLEEGVKSFNRLTAHGYSKEQAAFILASTPLSQWKKRTTRLAFESPLVDTKFNITRGDAVVVMEGGKLIGGYTLKEYSVTDGIPVLTRKTEDNGTTESKIPLNEFAYLNYPYKTTEFWMDLWQKAGGDPKAVQHLKLDLKSKEFVAASKIWRQLKTYSNADPNIESVFDTLIKFQKKDY